MILVVSPSPSRGRRLAARLERRGLAVGGPYARPVDLFDAMEGAAIPSLVVLDAATPPGDVRRIARFLSLVAVPLRHRPRTDGADGPYTVAASMPFARRGLAPAAAAPTMQ